MELKIRTYGKRICNYRCSKQRGFTAAKTLSLEFDSAKGKYVEFANTLAASSKTNPRTFDELSQKHTIIHPFLKN